MYLLGFLCLLSAAVAFPAPEKLRTNLPAPPPRSELQSDEKNKSSKEKVMAIDPVPQSLIKDESKKIIDSVKKPEAEKDEDKDKSHEIKQVIVEEHISKESDDTKELMESKQTEELVPPKKSDEFKEPKGSKELNEPKESSESWESMGSNKPNKESHESKEEKKDTKPLESEEDKSSKEDGKPTWVEVDIKKPFWSSLLSSLHLPHWPTDWPFPIKWPLSGWSKSRYSDQPMPHQSIRDELPMSDQLVPIYIIKESDFDID